MSLFSSDCISLSSTDGNRSADRDADLPVCNQHLLNTTVQHVSYHHPYLITGYTSSSS